MKKRKSGGSELQRVFLFLGVLLILLVGSFFVGMYLGSEGSDGPVVISESGDPGQTAEVKDVADRLLSDDAEQPDREQHDASAMQPDIGEPLPDLETPAESSKQMAPALARAPSGPVYAVQVGAFRDAGKARERVALLKKKGYDAYVVEPEDGGKSSLHKVRVGRFEKKQDADALSRKIRQREGLQTFVTYR